jgi:hypothetical protein
MKHALKLTMLITFIALPARAGGPYVLFSPNGQCSSDGIECWAYYDNYYVFIDITGIDDAVGVSFRLESNVFGPEDFGPVEPHKNVTMYGDLFTGATLVFPVGSYVSDTLLTIPISLHEPDGWDWDAGGAVDVVLLRDGSVIQELPDGGFYCSHCYGGSSSITWLHPDTISVHVGQDTTFAVKCKTFGHGLSGSDIAASDDLGWVTDCPYCSVWTQCGGCPWDYQYVNVSLTIPPGTDGGTLDQVTLTPTGPCCTSSTTTFIVKAIEPVAVEATSWSELKGLFGGR